MSTYLAKLLSRYRAVIGNGGPQAARLVDGFNTLRLADASLNKLNVNAEFPSHPLQVVILGPTQAGKSTLVNLLLDKNLAGISALAGYTVHTQGFAAKCKENKLASLEPMLTPLHRVRQIDLDADQYDQYSLETITTGAASQLSSTVIWDTPDFDSIESDGYRGAVLQTVALADVLILMVSKDKYADKTVWDMLAMVRTLGKPLLVCINKLDSQDQDTVLQSFEQRYQQQFDSTPPDIVILPFVPREIQAETSSNDGADDKTIAIAEATRGRLYTAVQHALDAVDRQTQTSATHQFIDTHWDLWLEPVHQEMTAATQWHEIVAQTINDAEQLYISRYLDNPQKYDTFNRALAELLTLLEIPGVAKTLVRTRQVVTWPARKLFGFGRAALQRDEHQTIPDQELDVLDLAFEQALIHLQSEMFEQQQQIDEQLHWWQAMHTCFQHNKLELTTQFSNAAVECQSEFAPRIEEAAKKLYGQLQEQPILLNTLRATRVSTDAAAVVLAVKSGGLAPADLIIAPAMLSITTLLTESVLGRFMDKIKADLKREQSAHVSKHLLAGVLKKRLLELAEELDDEHLLLLKPEEKPSQSSVA